MRGYAEAKQLGDRLFQMRKRLARTDPTLN